MRRAIPIVLCLAIGTGAAEAQTFEQAKACAGDAFHFCMADAETLNMDAIKSCLIINRLKISQKCREILKTHGSKK